MSLLAAEPIFETPWSVYFTLQSNSVTATWQVDL
jgi:hypothetical protein